MFFQQTYKIAGTFFALTFLLLSTTFAQKPTQIKPDSLPETNETLALTVKAKSITPDSAAHLSPTMASISTPQVLKKDVSPQTALGSSKIEGEVVKIVEEQPEFVGGLSAFFKYLNNNLQTPPEAFKERVEGRVSINFVVNIDSTISDVTVVRDTYFKRTDDDKRVEVDATKDKAAIDALNTEAMRVIKAMPKWKPAKNAKQVVRSAFTMPVTFK
jgi:periplasmic protein TonB